jgi:glycosyltransferase 2 family protein
MSRRLWTWGRVLGSLLTFAVLVWRVGTGPLADGVRAVDVRALAAAAGLGMLTTVCCAWRWRIVASGLRVRLTMPAAVAAYYRSVFLNLTLPGGVVGDVHRGVSHGRDTNDVGRALRAVAWERVAGQVVQVVLTVVLLLFLPSPVRSYMPLVAIALVLVVVAMALVARVQRGGSQSLWGRMRRVAATDVRDGLLVRRAWPGIALASTLVVCGHAATFLIAARTAGVTAPLLQLLPLALLAMAVMVLPSVGGWGPREGGTAWAFAAAGLGADQGVATAVAYGVMALFASLPGAAVLVVSWFRRTVPMRRSEPALPKRTAHA